MKYKLKTPDSVTKIVEVNNFIEAANIACDHDMRPCYIYRIDIDSPRIFGVDSRGRLCNGGRVARESKTPTMYSEIVEGKANELHTT